MPEAPESLLAMLEAQGIQALTRRHPPLHTVAESQSLRGDLPGLHVKNLFLRAKPPHPWLLIVAEEPSVGLGSAYGQQTSPVQLSGVTGRPPVAGPGSSSSGLIAY